MHIATTIDTGATAWVLVSAALVAFMTPGLAFFYGGMVRSKNVLGMLMQNVFAMGLVSVLWAAVGFSLAFGGDGKWIGNLDFVFMKDLATIAELPGYTGDFALIIPVLAFFGYQMMFAVITPALITGATADRMKFSAYAILIGVWAIIVYPTVAHWVFSPNGWLFCEGALDFAGGAVVHINAGAAALAVVLVLGKRRGWQREAMPPHNLPFTILGTGILWFGWFGFNGASYFAAKGAGFSFLTTTLSASAALLTWCLIEWFRDGKPTAVGAATGAVAGLVGITPAAGFVYMPQAMLIGAATSACCYIAVQIKAAIRFDDSLDAYAVHGVGGTVGALLTGLLAVPALVPADYFPKAAQLLEQGGNGALFLAHLKVVLISYGFVGAGTAIILWIVGSVVGLRVTPEEEERGLDYVAHGEEAYDPMTY